MNMLYLYIAFAVLALIIVFGVLALAAVNRPDDADVNDPGWGEW